MGCSPSANSARRQESLLALAVAQEALLLQQHQQAQLNGQHYTTSSRSTSCWLGEGTSPDTVMPPAYSEDPPPGHTSMDTRLTSTHTGDEHDQSTVQSHGGQQTPGASPDRHDLAASPTRTRRRKRSSRSSSSLPHDAILPNLNASPTNGSGGGSSRRRSNPPLRARRRISPMPASMASPPASSSSMRANEESEAQATLTTMRRPAATTPPQQSWARSTAPGRNSRQARQQESSSTQSAREPIVSPSRVNQDTESTADAAADAHGMHVVEIEEDNPCQDELDKNGQDTTGLGQGLTKLQLEQGQQQQPREGTQAESEGRQQIQVNTSSTNTEIPEREDPVGERSSQSQSSSTSTHPDTLRRNLFPSFQARRNGTMLHRNGQKQAPSEAKDGTVADKDHLEYPNAMPQQQQRPDSATTLAEQPIRETQRHSRSVHQRSHTTGHQLAPATTRNNWVERRQFPKLDNKVAPAPGPGGARSSAPPARLLMPVRTRSSQRLPPLDTANAAAAVLSTKLNQHLQEAPGRSVSR
eukprot:scpid41935/ scgid33485/ 